MGGTMWVYMAVHSQSVNAQSMEHGNASWCVIGSSNGYPTTHTHFPQFANRAQRTPASTVRENVPQALGPRLHARVYALIPRSFDCVCENEFFTIGYVPVVVGKLSATPFTFRCRPMDPLTSSWANLAKKDGHSRILTESHGRHR